MMTKLKSCSLFSELLFLKEMGVTEIKKYIFHDKLCKRSSISGGVTKKNGIILDKLTNGGGGEKTDGNSQFHLGNFENPGGGLDFSKMSEL